MDKTLRVFDNFKDAENAERVDDDQLTYEERFRIFMQLMEPYYAASPRLQRICRIDDLRERSICDDWGIRLQPLSKPKSDG
jgi:hypothetical protein